MFCAACRKTLGRPQVASYGRYRQPLQRALLSLKYRPDRALASKMATWLAELYRTANWRVTLILPVPLGAQRQRQRGFNQAGLIAEALAKRLNIECHHDLLIRRRETASQVGLDHHQRRLNVAGAFAAAQEPIAGQHVLLVDDLVTTGSTLRACSQALDQASAVFGLTVARA